MWRLSPPAGQSYRDFIATMHLPGQLAAVDPIVASFCGGAVGVLSTLMVVEANNASQQARRRCFYCQVRRRSRSARMFLLNAAWSSTRWLQSCGG